ncbi:MAG: PhzF family phenazine biosynthesis protein [Gemmatimonadota bacterium]
MATPIYQVDAFTAAPFRGNPAAVCPLDGPREAPWLQAVATEMNLSETAFLHPVEDGWRLRWFTPAMEVELCGHATLASAHVLWESGRLGLAETARFHTASGRLTARRAGDEITLDFPATPAAPATLPDGLARALGAHPLGAGKSAFDYLVEVASEAEVRALRPDFARLGELTARGVMVTAPAAAGDWDFVSRFFAPAAGIDEDPVTGSAHCCLGPFWGARLGRQELVGFQASARGGLVRVRLAGDRVLLGGRAVTVLRGELLA